jgi:hypothetical protein
MIVSNAKASCYTSWYVKSSSKFATYWSRKTKGFLVSVDLCRGAMVLSLLHWWLLKNETYAWMGINKIKGCDSEDRVWRLRKWMRGVKLEDVKSSSNNIGKFWIDICFFFVTKSKRFIFWEGLKGTILMEMIREECIVHWESNVDVFSLVKFMFVIKISNSLIFTCYMMKIFLFVEL